MTPIPRLKDFPLVSTNQVDQAEHILSQSLDVCHITKVEDRRSFSVEMNGVRVGGMSLIYNRYGGHARVESELPGRPVFFNLGGGSSSRFDDGSRSQFTSPQAPILITPTNRLKIDRPADSSMIVLRASIGQLEQKLETLIGRHLRGSLVFDPDASMKEGAGAHLARMIQFLTSELERNPTLACNPLFLRNCADLLTNGLLSLPHNRLHLLDEDRSHEVSPGLVARAEEYMRSHLKESVTVSDLLKACDCSRSALFAAFRNAKGYSPMEFLAEQRLQAAHHTLQNPTSATTVASAAMNCGFSHLGRFSGSYHRRFGEPPSETLRKCRFRSPSKGRNATDPETLN